MRRFQAVCGAGKVSVPALEELLLKARPSNYSFWQDHNTDSNTHSFQNVQFETFEMTSLDFEFKGNWGGAGRGGGVWAAGGTCPGQGGGQLPWAHHPHGSPSRRPQKVLTCLPHQLQKVIAEQYFCLCTTWRKTALTRRNPANHIQELPQKNE